MHVVWKSKGQENLSYQYLSITPGNKLQLVLVFAMLVMSWGKKKKNAGTTFFYKNSKSVCALRVQVALPNREQSLQSSIWDNCCYEALMESHYFPLILEHVHGL